MQAMRRIVLLLKSLWAKLFDKKQPKPLFHFEYVWEQDVVRLNLDRASRVTEDQRSEFVFEGESLYKTEGYGHSFVHGFFQQYYTKSGKSAEHYYTKNLWLIGHEFYEWLDGKFVLVPQREYKPLDLTTPIPFPLIKSALPKSGSTEVFSVQPMTPPNK